MIKINQIKLMLDEDETMLPSKVAEYLHITESEIKELIVIKKSIDARKKDRIGFIYHVGVEINKEFIVYQEFLEDPNVQKIDKKKAEPIVYGDIPIKERPVVVGSGPCGLFCALVLAQKGYNPIVLERGKSVKDRLADVQTFWKKGVLNENSNVQFGEGGAGTFSDGKLNTLIKDKLGFGKKVLEEFALCGAPSEILYINKPHLGTDNLHHVIANMREKIISLGGTFRFETCLTGVTLKEGAISELIVNENEHIPCTVAVLALGHSSRDTFSMLHDLGCQMEAKPFAMGVRIEHLQSDINKMQYGKNFAHPKLPVADYKLTYQTVSGRGVYSFCPCPGGMVVGAASEKDSVVTNGMSYYARDLKNANSALVVSVTPQDFANNHPLAGVEFQRTWERQAFKLTNSYKAPAQLVGNFLGKQQQKGFASVVPSFTNGVELSDLRECLPSFVSESLEEGLRYFGAHYPTFANGDAVMTGVETRTSSPVKIIRDEHFMSNITGLYPAGEGAGYAGGIMSAAIDGIKAAHHIMERFSR